MVRVQYIKQTFIIPNLSTFFSITRLGALGFLATNDKAAAGNMGIYDQLMVLKWVQKNIEKFGGDAGKVELVSKELNHLVAILHVYAGGLNFMKQKKNCYYFSKRKWKYFYTFYHFYREKSSKRAK